MKVIPAKVWLARRIAGIALPPEVVVSTAVARPGAGEAPAVAAEPVVDYAHLPPSPDDPGHTRLAAAAFADPWPGSVPVTDDLTGTGLTVAQAAAALERGEAPALTDVQRRIVEAHALTQ